MIRITRNLLVLVALSAVLTGCGRTTTQTPGENTPTSSTFRARVVAVEQITRFSGTVIPVANDPRFVLTLELLEPCDVLGKSAGAEINLGIHSPSRLFGSDDPIGLEWTFTVERRETESGVSYWLDDSGSYR